MVVAPCVSQEAFVYTFQILSIAVEFPTCFIDCGRACSLRRYRMRVQCARAGFTAYLVRPGRHLSIVIGFQGM